MNSSNVKRAAEEGISSAGLGTAASFSRGSAYLFVGQLAAFLVSFVAFVINSKLLAARYGSSQPWGWLFIITALPSVFSLLGDLNISTGVLNKTTGNFHAGQRTDASRYFWTGIAVSVVVASIYSSITYFLGGFVVTSLYNKSVVSFLVPVAATGVLSSVVYNAGWSGCLATDKTSMNSAMLLVGSMIQVTVSPLLILSGYGIWGVAVANLVVSPLVSGLPALLVAARSLGFSRPSRAALSDALSFGLPLTGNNLGGSIQATVFNLLISRFGSSTDVGNYSVALRLNPIVAVLSYPFSTLVFPAFSKLNRKEEVSIAFNVLVKLTVLAVAPVCFSLVLVAPQLLVWLFGTVYATGAWYLELLGALWLAGGMGSVVAIGLLTGTGRTRLVLKAGIVGSLSAIAANVVLIPLYGVTGAIIASIVSTFPPLFLVLKYVRDEFGGRYPTGPVLRGLAGSILTAAAGYLVIILLATVLPGLAALGIGAVVEIMVYATVLKHLNLLLESELSLVESALVGVPALGTLVRASMKVYRRL